MRTKTLLAAAAMTAAFTVASYAQTVYSVNAVGYVNVSVPASQFALVANPLNQPTNSLNAVLGDLPAQTSLWLWNGTTFGGEIRRTATGWLPPTAGTNVINPGQPFFVRNGTANPVTITFVGEVPQGDLSIQYPAGFSLLASQVPQAGKVETDLKLPVKANDQIYTFANGTYGSPSRKLASGAWVGGGGEPTIGVAQGFWLQTTNAGTWARTFNVNQ